jgi:hypothetical protein
MRGAMVTDGYDPQEEPTDGADPADAGWPQLSDLDLSVCLTSVDAATPPAPLHPAPGATPATEGPQAP